MRKLDKCFIINLARRTDKKKEMSYKLKRLKLDIEIEFFEAIDGKSIDSQYMKKHSFKVFKGWKDPSSKNRFHSRELKLGEIGCALSHYFVWKKIACSDLDVVLILEDDAKFLPNFEKRLARQLEILEQKKIDWDLLYLGRIPLFQDEKRISKEITIPKFSYCTYSYMITRKGAQKLLTAKYEKNIIPVDEFLPAMFTQHPRMDVNMRFGNKKKLNAFAIDPELVVQEEVTGVTDTEATDFVKDEWYRMDTQLSIQLDPQSDDKKLSLTISGATKKTQLSLHPAFFTLIHWIKEIRHKRFCESDAFANAGALDRINVIQLLQLLKKSGALKMDRSKSHL